MRTIRNLTQSGKKVYIFLKDEAARHRFMLDADREGITYGDNAKVADRMVDDVMSLQSNGTVCFIGYVGKMCYYYANQSNIVRVDYEKYISGDMDYSIVM